MQNVVNCYGTSLYTFFEAYARIFVYTNAVTPATCVDNIFMNLVFI